MGSYSYPYTEMARVSLLGMCRYAGKDAAGCGD